MRALLIVNPAAGGGRGWERWREASSGFLGAGSGNEARLTSEPGEASRLALDGLAEGFEALVAVGGDGTLGEVADGFLRAPEKHRGGVALGLLPTGSGCDFAAHWGFDAKGAVLRESLARGCVRRVDAARVDYELPGGGRGTRFFLTMAGLGLGSEVARRAEGAGKALGGFAGYLAGAVLSLLKARPLPLTLTADGEALPPGLFHALVLANTKRTGGGMLIAPEADPQDGLLDLVSIGPLSRWELLRKLPLVYSGKHLGVPGVAHRLIRRLEVSSSEAVPLNIDGEVVGALPAVFEALPGAVPLLLPAT
jgi:YegS/Rv2252/BmrU family lipid kinase